MGDAREPEDTPFDPVPSCPEERRGAEELRGPGERWDPEERWSVGAAADRAGVTHNELIGWVQRGRLEVETVRRDGVEIRVVRAGDVAAIAPRVRGGARTLEVRPGPRVRPAPEPPAGSPAPPAADTPAAGPPVAPGVADANDDADDRGAPGAVEAAAAPRRAEPDGPDPAAAAAIAALRDEVARLRSELEHRPPLAAQRAVPPALRRALVAAAVVGALVGVTAGLLIGDIDGPAGRDGAGPSAVHAAFTSDGPAAPSSIAGADGPPAPPRDFARPPDPPLTSPDAAAQDADAPADTVAADAGAAETAPAETAPADLGASDTGADAAPRSTDANDPAGDAAAPAAAGSDAGSDAGSGSGSAGSGLNIAPPPWERDLEEPRWLASVLEDGPHVDAVHADGAGGVEPCAYRPLIDDGDDAVLTTLGPCYGAPGLDAAGAPRSRGTHRVAGVHACAHHAFVERVTRASRDASARAKLAAEADAALAQDLAPPLLRLRAERAAGAFLSDVVGSWVACGLDGRPLRGLEGDPPAHAWSAPRIVDGEDGARAVALTLQSWLRVEENGPLRSFTLELVLGDGPRGDRMDALRWGSDGSPPSDAR